MTTIKFSHKYDKMPEFLGDTWILEVFTANHTDLHEAFIEYDTKYEEGHYSLPQGKVIILLLWSFGQVWTTVRLWTADKERYYRALRSTKVDIEIHGVKQ